MKKFFDYLKKVAVQMVISSLKENSDELAKKIAKKNSIPFLTEKQEVEFADKLIEGIAELLEEMFAEKPKKKKK